MLGTSSIPEDVSSLRSGGPCAMEGAGGASVSHRVLSLGIALMSHFYGQELLGLG